MVVEVAAVAVEAVVEATQPLAGVAAVGGVAVVTQPWAGVAAGVAVAEEAEEGGRPLR